MMDIIVGAPRSGKTDQLIKMAANDYSYIICHNRDEAQRIANKAREVGLAIPSPITYDEFISVRYNAAGVRGFLIDNAECLLQRMAGRVELKGLVLNAPGITGQTNFIFKSIL